MGFARPRILFSGVLIIAVVLLFVVFSTIPLFNIIGFGRDLAFDQRMLESHVYSVEPVPGGVRFYADGTIGVRLLQDKKHFEQSFILATGDHFRSLTRNGRWSEFVLHKIEERGVIVEYDASIGQADGEDRSMDHGLIYLAWRKNQDRYRWPYAPGSSGMQQGSEP